MSKYAPIYADATYIAAGKKAEKIARRAQAKARAKLEKQEAALVEKLGALRVRQALLYKVFDEVYDDLAEKAFEEAEKRLGIV